MILPNIVHLWQKLIHQNRFSYKANVSGKKPEMLDAKYKIFDLV